MAPADGEKKLTEVELRAKSAAGTLTDEEADQLNRLKGKGAALEEPEAQEEADDEAEDEGDEEDEDDEEEDEDEDEDEEEEEEERPAVGSGKKAGGGKLTEPRKKKQKASGSKAGGSKAGGDDEEASDVEVVKGLSGDEVDASNIIEGGRRSRRGRASAAPRYTKQAAGDDSDDEW